LKFIFFNNNINTLNVKNLKKEFFLYKNYKNSSNNYYNHYVYSFFLKRNFNKINFKKTINKNLNNMVKKNSQLFLQNSIRGGNKLKFLSYLNFMRNNFYFFFLKKFEFFQKKFPTYNIFYNFSKTDLKFFDFDFLLNLILKNNDSIFFTKAITISKKIKQKNKTKSKYNLDVQYLKSEKRIFFTLKQIHLYSNNYNFYKYSERLLMSFFNVFFLEKSSDIYKNKIMTYKNILKKNSK
jgi:hypothetical protein